MCGIHDDDRVYLNKKQFDMICTEYMDRFGFEWVEEFTLNGA